MREIKFRAWVKTFNQDDEGMYYVIEPYRPLKDGTYDRIHARRDFESEEVFKFKSEEEPFVLMQYTGLKDRNGVEIYEGDVLATEQLEDLPDIDKWEREIIGAVEWDDEYHGFRNLEHANDSIYGPYYAFVAGNIYENPELLK